MSSLTGESYSESYDNFNTRPELDAADIAYIRLAMAKFGADLAERNHMFSLAELRKTRERFDAIYGD